MDVKAPHVVARALAVCVTALYGACLAVGLATGPGGVTAVAVAGGAVSLLAWVATLRSRGWGATGLAAVAGAGAAVAAGTWAGDLTWFCLCLLAGAVASLATRRMAVAFVAGCVALLAAEWVVTPDVWAAWMAGTAFSAGAALVARRDRDLVQQLRAAQAGLAEQARSEERTRIARELHDVLAHSLTVSLLHVTSARLAVEHEPEDAARSLAEAERLGRQSLEEVRATVGLLRQTDEAGAGLAAPLPGLDGIAELVGHFGVAGREVSLALPAPLPPVPATTGLGAYRIVQEALTNATKHAPGAPVAVAVDLDAGRLTIRVDSAGSPGRGHGLGTMGMRERAEALGGTCQAGPGGRGWLVEAVLPTGRA